MGIWILPLMFNLLTNLVLFIISTCFALWLLTASQGDRMDRHYFPHFTDVLSETILGIKSLDDKQGSGFSLTVPNLLLNI